MKAWKRLSAVVLAVFAVAALTGTALAAEPLIAAAPAINVQMNGEPLAFSDAAPEAVDGRTFVPLYAVTEALGAKVGYDGAASTITIQRNGASLSMVLGADTASVTEDGQVRTIQMDVIPYAKNNRTYVPIAFVADALGCGVGWDQSSRTVIIVDVDALMGDASFDLMDNFAAYCEKQSKDKNMAVAGTLDMSIKDKSGQTLTKPLTAKGSVNGVTSGTKAQLAWELKLSDLSELAGVAGTAPLEQAMIQQMLSVLSDMKGEVRIDMESMKCYLSLPMAFTGKEEDTWYSLDLGAYEAQLLSGMSMAQLNQLEEAGIREILTTVIQSMPLTDSEYSYTAVAEVASIYVDLLSDQAFTQTGNTYVAQGAPDMPITITLAKQGDDIVSADITVDFDSSKFDASLQPTEKISMKLTEHAAPDKVAVKMDMSIEDEEATVELALDVGCVPTSKAPVATLPAGVQAVPMN